MSIIQGLSGVAALKIRSTSSTDREDIPGENSLRRLGTDYIDLYQIHWPDATTPVAETMEALLQLLRQGKIRAAGVSNYPAELMDEAEKTISLASNQVPYSMVERSIEEASRRAAAYALAEIVLKKTFGEQASIASDAAKAS